MMNAGQVLNDRYEILKEIGKGGMSTVYQARDLINGKLLAVKDAIRSGQDQNQAVEQKLVDEGYMFKELSKPHLPKIHDIIEKPDSFLLVMDYIQGESLDRVISREGAQPLERVLDWGVQICDVFDYLHSRPTPIIYRDMKPANVMLQPNGQLMMIDFGTARNQKVGVAMAADTLCLGTAGFAAPEQFGGIGQSTPRTDIFCLGATLYNMITGHSPCDRPQGILPLENWNPALKDSPISYIIYKCTRNDPDSRYQSARELREDLVKAQNGTFGDPSTWGKSGKLSGNLKKDWQKQNVKTAGGLSGGLSGLLQRNKPVATEKAKSGELKAPEPIVSGSGWQTVHAVPANHAAQNVTETRADIHYNNIYDPAPAAAPQAEASPWKRLTLIGLVIAVAMMVLSFVFLLAALPIIGFVFMIIAFGAAVLAVVGVIFARVAGK